MTSVLGMMRPVPVLALAALVSAQTPARPSVKLSAVLAAYLPAAGTQVRGLAWTSGDSLPVAWESAAPVPAAEYEIQQGFPLRRTGTLAVEVGSERHEAALNVLGNQAGIQQVAVTWQQLSGPFDAASQALVADGIVLTPLKCRRETEPASFGHVVHVAQFPGKLATGLWENWNCGHDGCGYVMTLLYRKSEVAAVECAGG